MNIFVWKLSKIAAQKKVFFSLTFFTFEVPFNGLFSPTSQSWMSNIFRDSESLGKSNGKKWSNIWTFLFERGLKSPRKKKFFCCCWFCLGPPSYGIGATIRIGWEMLCLRYAGFLSSNDHNFKKKKKKLVWKTYRLLMEPDITCWGSCVVCIYFMILHKCLYKRPTYI